MASPVAGDRLLGRLRDIVDLLRSAGESSAASSMEALANAVEASSGDDVGRQGLVREILGLFGGMGSFQDMVLQDASGVLPQQDEFDRLRTELFQQARRELR